MEIRRAISKDIDGINELLYQVAETHAKGRPDIFKSASKKYTDEQLLKIIKCDESPIFVAVENNLVIGYMFCIYQVVENSLLLQNKKTLYIDDVCVDEKHRGKKVGSALFERVVNFAKENDFDNVNLNVWTFNEKAYKFYQKCGMTPQKITMEKPLK